MRIEIALHLAIGDGGETTVSVILRRGVVRDSDGERLAIVVTTTPSSTRLTHTRSWRIAVSPFSRFGMS